MSSKVAQVTRNLRHQQWLNEIQACNNRPKGMTVNQWCELNNVNLHSYYWHMHTLRQMGIDLAEAAGIDLSEPRTTFVELTPPTESTLTFPTSAVTIRIGESVMEISEDVSDEFLARIMNSLRS